ncbi:MAG: Ion transport 2 domain protein [Solirubrobacteraceae bacterium]|nr:Ion transport 2 domain protein [Solirubrobacteraceae bacterium]
MRVVAGLAGLGLIGLMLSEFFVTFLLPRRVKRDPRIARGIYGLLWRPWRRLGRRMGGSGGDTLLGFFGPMGMLALMSVLAIGLVAGFALLHWAFRSDLVANGVTHFTDDVYYSAGAFISASESLRAGDGWAKALTILEAGSGLAVLFIVIGYLPALYQAFSSREVAVSQLDARAGSPPDAALFLARSVRHGGWNSLDAFLLRWETWSAELMETHLAYPILCWFRSQHVNQNWLAAMTCVMDASAFTIAAAPDGEGEAARLTFAIGRHAMADLSYTVHAKPRKDNPERLDAATLAEVVREVRDEGVEVADEGLQERLAELQAMYEPYAYALAHHLELQLPVWWSPDRQEENWRRTAWRVHRRTPLP